MKELIIEKEKNIEKLFNQFTQLNRRKIQLIEKNTNLINDCYEIEEKIKKYQHKVDNINNLEHNKKFTKMCAIAHHIILTLLTTIILCLNFSYLSILPIIIIFIMSNIVSGSIMFCASKTIINILEKKIDSNYKITDLKKIIKTLKGEKKELTHQHIITDMTIDHLKKQINNILSTMNLEKYEVRKLRNQSDYSLIFKTKNNDKEQKIKQIKK